MINPTSIENKNVDLLKQCKSLGGGCEYCAYLSFIDIHPHPQEGITNNDYEVTIPYQVTG